MAEQGLVDIVLPTGEAATVPEQDLGRAIAAGAKVPTPKEEPAAIPGAQELLTGMPENTGRSFAEDAALGLLARSAGAARTMSLGLSDKALTDGAYVVGGQKLRNELQNALNVSRKEQRINTLAGETFGLVAPNPVSALGDAAQAGTAARMGEGLLAETAAMGARGLGEGAALGAQQQITENSIQDHELTGEALFAVGKDALLGGAAGAGLGAVGGGLSKLFARGPGRMADATLDEATGGVSGAGKVIREDAKAAEGMISDLQKAGATSEQAAQMVDDLNRFSKMSSTDAGPISGAIDSLASEFAAKRAAGNPEMQEILAKGYTERATRLAQRGQILDEQALKLKAATDRVLTAERAMDEAQFLQRPDRMAKLIDTSRGELQRDMSARMNQEVDSTLKLLESTATKGGSAVAVSKLRKQLTDVAKLSVTAARDDAGRIVQLPPKRLHEIYMGLNRMKQAVGREAGFGIAPHLRTEAQREFGPLYEKLRLSLEDEGVWGAEAGSNQRVLNEVFSTDFKRSSDFGNRFTVGLDEAKGIPLPEADAEKLKNGLLKKLGSEADSQQAIKSTETWIDRNRKRITALEQHGDLTPEQASLVGEGRAALKDFETTLAGAKKEGEILARLEEQQLQEQGQGMGGLVGLIGDLVTRPLTTVERLAGIRQATRRLEKAVEAGFEKLTGATKSVAEKASVRPKADVTKEIVDIKELAGNPMKLESRLADMVGDLANHAPKIAEHVKATGARAIVYLAQEAPAPHTNTGPFAGDAKPRISDQQLADWENKRKAVLGAVDGKTAPETLIADMKKGKLNRDAIKAIEFVSPKMFARLQDMAWEHLQRMQARGELDRMPYQQKAAFSTLLGVPADQTWRPDFIGLMQAAKAMPTPAQQASGPPQPNMGPSKRAIEMNTNIYATDGQLVAGGGAVH